MAKLEKVLTGNFDSILKKIEDGIIEGSVSATLEESSDFVHANSRCSVRVFERYSYTGGNRVSLSVTLYEARNSVFLSAITSGGSQAMFFKFNTFGEETFLQKLEELL